MGPHADLTRDPSSPIFKLFPRVWVRSCFTCFFGHSVWLSSGLIVLWSVHVLPPPLPFFFKMIGLICVRAGFTSDPFGSWSFLDPRRAQLLFSRSHPLSSIPSSLSLSLSLTQSPPLNNSPSLLPSLPPSIYLYHHHCSPLFSPADLGGNQPLLVH